MEKTQEDLGKYIDSIIFNGHLVFINYTPSFFEEYYSEDTLKKLVIIPMEDYVFKGFNEQVKEAFYSSDGALPVCTKHFDIGEQYFSCIECRADETCVMCQECFLNSIHSNHEYTASISHKVGGCCDCGDEEAWKCHPTCTIHQISDISKPLNDEFVQRFGLIVKYICDFLEKIAMNDFSLLETEHCRMLASYNDMRRCEHFVWTGDNLIGDECIAESNDDQNMCLLVFNDEYHERNDVINCFKTCLSTSNLEAIVIANDFSNAGYTYVVYRNSLEECQRIKNLIEEYPYSAFSEFPLLCKIVPVQILYFIRLSRPLIEFIHEFCSTKSQLCDMLSRIIFRGTSFASIYIANERHLWKNFRYDVIYKLFLLTLSSDYGKMYIAELYLHDLDHIYQNYMIDDHDRSFCFVNLTVQFINCPSLIAYFIENGVLVKMINCLARALNDINISKGVKVSQIYEQGILIRNKCNRIFTLFKSIYECLMAPFPIKKWSDKFRSKLSSYGRSLIEFCYCFDDLEPLKKVHGTPENEIDYSYTLKVVLYFHHILINSIKWFFNCPEIVSEMLFKFLLEAKQEISSVMDMKTASQAVETLMTYQDVENSEFSVFHMFRRIYFDILVRAVIEKNPDGRKYFEEVVQSEIMLIWLSLPSVTSISFYTSYLSATWTRNSTHLYSIFRIYHSPKHFHYLYMQDFTVVQILMAHMAPDRFIKYLIFNMIPSIREKVEFSHPLPYILSFVQSEHDIAFREVMALVYNAMSERHFVGQIKDYESFLVERQLIHYLACADRTYRNILDAMYLRRDIFSLGDGDFSKYLDDTLQRVAYVKTSLNSDDKYSLKPSYFNKVNLYYFMHSAEQLSILFQNITLVYKNDKSQFEVSEIVELRPEFIGIKNFIFSDEFFELIVYSLTKLSFCSDLRKYTPQNDLILSLMCLCYIFKSSQNENVNFTHKKRIDAIFVPHDAFGGKNIVEILNKASNEINNPILNSIIIYFFKLSNAVIDPTQNTTYQPKTKAQHCREGIFKKLAEQRDNFFKHNQDWLIFKGSQNDESENEQTSREYQIKLFCEVCQTIGTYNCSKNFDIFQFSTDYITCAFTRWTRRLENIQPAELDFDEYDGVDFSLAYDSVYASWESKNMRPALVISGCGHSFHVNCQPAGFDKSMERFTKFDDTTYYDCCVCSQTNNFFLPSNCPIISISGGDANQIFIGTLVRHIMSLHESGRLHESLISKSELIDNERYREELFTKNLTSDSNKSNFYLKTCYIFFYGGRKYSCEYNLSQYCECVISTMISSLKSTIDNIEKYHRHMSNQPSIFNSTFVEGSNFTVSTQLSRLCYYACGLAPSLKQLGIPIDDISRLLTPLYSERLRKFGDLLKLLDICEPQSEDLNVILSVDHFEEFSSILMTVSAIINLNPKANATIAKNWEVSLVHMFYLLIVFNVFYKFHSEKNLSRTDMCEDYDVEDISSIWQIYSSIYSPHATPTINIQRDLYESYLFNSLLFIRKVSILFYQLFNWNSELLIGKDSLDPSVELKLLLKYLHVPENPSTAWTMYDSSFTICLIKYSSISTLSVPNMLTREQYFKNKFGLVSLPSSYLELLRENQNLKCKSCNGPAKSSLKCLICGGILSFMYVCSCEELPYLGEIVLPHIIECDGTFALFLQINPPRILYYRMRRSSYLNISIYQDTHGESMFSSPFSLKLSKERYARLNDLYQRDWLETISEYIPHTFI